MNDESSRVEAEDFFKNGISELKKNNFLRAKDYFLKANKLIPDRISILYNLAFTYYHLNENQNAKKILEKIILIDKNDFDIIKLFTTISLDENNLLSNSEVSFNITNIFTTSSAVISSSNQILKLSGIKFKVEPLVEIFRINQSPSYAKLAIAQDGAFFNCYFEGGGFTSSYNLTRQV